MASEPAPSSLLGPRPSLPAPGPAAATTAAAVPPPAISTTTPPHADPTAVAASSVSVGRPEDSPFPAVPEAVAFLGSLAHWTAAAAPPPVAPRGVPAPPSLLSSAALGGAASADPRTLFEQRVHTVASAVLGSRLCVDGPDGARVPTSTTCGRRLQQAISRFAQVDVLACVPGECSNAVHAVVRDLGRCVLAEVGEVALPGPLRSPAVLHEALAALLLRATYQPTFAHAVDAATRARDLALNQRLLWLHSTGFVHPALANPPWDSLGREAARAGDHTRSGGWHTGGGATAAAVWRVVDTSLRACGGERSPVEKLLCVADACRSAVSTLCTHAAAQQLTASKATCAVSVATCDADPCDVPVAVGGEGAVLRALSAEVLVGALVQALVVGATPHAEPANLCAALSYIREYWTRDHDPTLLDDCYRHLCSVVECVEGIPVPEQDPSLVLASTPCKGACDVLVPRWDPAPRVHADGSPSLTAGLASFRRDLLEFEGMVAADLRLSDLPRLVAAHAQLVAACDQHQ